MIEWFKLKKNKKYIAAENYIKLSLIYISYFFSQICSEPIQLKKKYFSPLLIVIIEFAKTILYFYCSFNLVRCTCINTQGRYDMPYIWAS